MFESIINKLSIQYIVFFNPFSPRPIPLLFYLSDNFNRQGRASRWERVIKVRTTLLYWGLINFKSSRGVIIGMRGLIEGEGAYLIFQVKVRKKMKPETDRN